MAFVTRYDYVRGTIDGQWAISPNGTGAAPTNTFFISQQTAEITNHVFSESITWNPCARLYLQGNGSLRTRRRTGCLPSRATRAPVRSTVSRVVEPKS